ncbi:MAG: hypothetical protein FWG41_02635, partial [Methanomassiliicoccaceae archaeon]|nr:hypothetical protein [Methanomassiliicoccaceae archaeon]
YSVSVSGSQAYSGIAMKNGMRPMTEIYIFYDKEYASCYEAEEGPIGSKPLDQRTYVEMLAAALASSSGTPVRILSADELREAMDDDVAAGDVQKGLVVISGALPDTIYAGSGTDPIFDWLGGGGRLYWLGNILGKYYSTVSEIVDVSAALPNYQELFFGVECLNTDTAGNGFVSNDFTGGPTDSLRYDLSLKNNRIKYGVNTAVLGAGHVNYRAVGYSDDNNEYASIVLAEYAGGKGMVCVLAGDYSRNQRSDLVQVLSSGIDHSTEILGTVSGSVRYGTHTGMMDIGPPEPNMTAYIYLGGYFPVYGRLFSL